MDTQTTDLAQLKSDLIAEIDKRVEDKILEPTNADLLRKLIHQAENINEALAIAALGTTYKRTGLHFDKRFERMTDDIAYFRKDEALSFHADDNKPTHKLIIGDNYEALQNLLVQYKGGIDVIYIDPPYGKDSMGEFAKTNYQNDLTRDNLLSMLYPRLQLAKQLLSDSGIIFCSIDDKNQAYVKCLFDEVFGEKSYIETFIWNKTSTPPALANKSRKTHEFILCYQKINNKSEKFIGLVNEGGDAPLLNDTNRENILTFPANYVRTNLRDGIYKAGMKERVELLNDVKVENGVISTQFSLKGRFRWIQDTLDKEISEKCLLIIKTEKFAIRYCREGERIVAPANFITEKIYTTDTSINKTDQNVDTNERGGEELECILGKKVFDFPKPMSLISYLISFIDNPNAVILDFFAGSGTTGHAVLDLNQKNAEDKDLFTTGQDSGNRTFILCQLDEKTDTTPNGIAHDVTSKRLKRIMTGKCYDGNTDFPWIKKNKPYGGNLDVYTIEHVANFETTQGKSPLDVIDETLYGHPKCKSLKEKVDWLCTHFTPTQKRIEE